MPIRSKEMLASARGQACICCNSMDGTVVAAHYTGFRQHSLGKGTGIKCGDIFTAHLCRKCHAKFDSLDISTFIDRYMRKIDQSEQFMFLILKTWEKLYLQGKIIITL
jgi:hypothetical protein